MTPLPPLTHTHTHARTHAHVLHTWVQAIMPSLQRHVSHGHPQVDMPTFCIHADQAIMPSLQRHVSHGHLQVDTPAGNVLLICALQPRSLPRVAEVMTESFAQSGSQTLKTYK